MATGWLRARAAAIELYGASPARRLPVAADFPIRDQRNGDSNGACTGHSCSGGGVGCTALHVGVGDGDDGDRCTILGDDGGTVCTDLDGAGV